VIEFFGSLPGGLVWYPVVAVLAFLMVRRVWDLRENPKRGSNTAWSENDQVARLAVLVGRAGSDTRSRAELERRCFGLLLNVHGYPKYSLESCRRLAHDLSGTDAGKLAREHVEEWDNGVVTAPEFRAGLPARVDRLLTVIENTGTGEQST
jgi:hypothetical protein